MVNGELVGLQGTHNRWSAKAGRVSHTKPFSAEMLLAPPV
jgi:hypothetical protein